MSQEFETHPWRRWRTEGELSCKIAGNSSRTRAGSEGEISNPIKMFFQRPARAEEFKATAQTSVVVWAAGRVRDSTSNPLFSGLVSWPSLNLARPMPNRPTPAPSPLTLPPTHPCLNSYAYMNTFHCFSNQPAELVASLSSSSGDSDRGVLKIAGRVR